MTTFNRRQALAAAAAFAACGAGTASAAQAPVRTLPEYSGPWVSLFNGRNLDGWTYFQEGQGTTDRANTAVIQNGVIHCLGPKHTGGDRPGFGFLATAREYGNYHLRLDYRYGEKRFEPRLLQKRNSGVLVHAFPQDKIWPNTVECQLEEGDCGDLILMNTRCWPGGDLGGTPAWPNNALAQRVPHPTGPNRPAIERQRLIKNGDFERRLEWNTVEVLTVGDKLAVLVNGRIVNTAYEIVGQDVNDRDLYTPLTKGRIGLEIEGAEVMFRNIQLRAFA
jgi:hypothetical protein